MKEILEAVTGLVPIIQSSPMWVKGYFTVWVIATGALILSVIFTYTPVPAKVSTPVPNPALNPIPNPVPPAQAGGGAKWPMTGDPAIDKAHTDLNNNLAKGSISETQIVAALRNVFYKRIFIHIYEAAPQNALFTFCRAQLLLEDFVGNFSNPDVRRKILDATQNLISLQDQVGQLYGPTFQREQLCAIHGATLNDYTSNLPPKQKDKLVGDPFDKAQRTLGLLRANLNYVNLMD